MGNARWDSNAWAAYSRKTAQKDRSQVFTAHGLKDDMNPKGVTVRESRDSEQNPGSTPIIVGLDVTASMGMIPEALVKHGLGTMIEEIHNRRPVTDPHIMMMGIGDARCDRSPLQVSQFEADLRIAEQLTDIFLEGGGGGQGSESYNLAWYFAGMKTSTDAFEKRGKKGYLFTIGDEEPIGQLDREHVRQVIGDEMEVDHFTDAQLLQAAERMYDVFHIVIEEGMHARMARDRVMGRWGDLLGERVIPLSDYRKLPEVIVSTIQVNEGTDHDTVVNSWSGDTSLVVQHATNALKPRGTEGGSTGVVRL